MNQTSCEALQIWSEAPEFWGEACQISGSSSVQNGDTLLASRRSTTQTQSACHRANVLHQSSGHYCFGLLGCDLLTGLCNVFDEKLLTLAI